MKQRLVTPFLMWAIVAAGFVVVLALVQHVTFFHRSIVTTALTAAAIAHWAYFFFGAAYVNRSAARSAAGVNRLVTYGVYSMVRHPIYSADIILAWGIFLSVPTLRALLCVSWLTIVLIAWMKVEEKALEERFGEEYADYKRTTPMVIPRYRRTLSR